MKINKNKKTKTKSKTNQHKHKSNRIIIREIRKRRKQNEIKEDK